MFWSILATMFVITLVGWFGLPGLLVLLGVKFARKKRLEGKRVAEQRLLQAAPGELVPVSARISCPKNEREQLKSLERRLVTAHENCLAALDTKFPSELARARVAPVLEEAYAQIRSEIESIYAFCNRNDLTGTLEKARTSTTAQDIYMNAYQRDLAKVDVAISKTEECLAAYERTIATLEVSSVESDIGSDFDASIEMLRDLRDELPLYNLEDRI